MNTLQDELEEVKKLIPNAMNDQLDLISAGFFQGACRLLCLIERNKHLSANATVALLVSLKEEIKSKADDYVANGRFIE